MKKNVIITTPPPRKTTTYAQNNLMQAEANKLDQLHVTERSGHPKQPSDELLTRVCFPNHDPSGCPHCKSQAGDVSSVASSKIQCEELSHPLQVA